MSITVALTHRQRDFSLEVAFATNTRLVALVGPSGSGNTTVLNVIGGLVRAEARARRGAGSRAGGHARARPPLHGCTGDASVTCSRDACFRI